MKKALNVILRVIGTIVWVVAFSLVTFAFALAGEGALASFIGLFLVFVLLLGFACFSAPLSLRVFTESLWKRAALSVAFAVVYFLLVWGGLSLAKTYFKDFTQAKWQKYPNQRHRMVEDLEENHGIIGLPAEEIIPLLGEPRVKSDKVYTYQIGEREYAGMWQIEFHIEDGIVVKVTKMFFE
ncbi:MAG: hypothetical protein FWF10_04690 [Clostridiales bacterium]|nr:hypothetical protein [Clostridiales bacterium]